MTKLETKVSQCLEFLEACRLPINGLSKRAREKMAKAVLSLGDMRPGSKWDELKDFDNGFTLASRAIIDHMNSYWGEKIGKGSYDDIRRKDLKLPVESLVIVRSNPGASRNDPTRAYAWNPEFAAVARNIGQKGWKGKLAPLLHKYCDLSATLSPVRTITMVPITFEGETFEFSPGLHNELQKAIIEQFLPRYGYGARVLYVGDTANKGLHKDEAGLQDIGMFQLEHGELPDVVAYSKAKDWLYLIEAVYSSGPIDPVRKKRLTELLGDKSASVVWVNAFLNRSTFRKWAADLAWETEVWVADEPDHLIHFNGGKFLGPHS